MLLFFVCEKDGRVVCGSSTAANGAEGVAIWCNCHVSVVTCISDRVPIFCDKKRNEGASQEA